MFGGFTLRPKLCGNCAFPQNFNTKKLGEITVFFAVLPFWKGYCNIVLWNSHLRSLNDVENN